MWLEDQVESSDTKTVDEKWLKIPDSPIGKTAEVRLRILDEEPIGVWRHWFGQRAYNCPGMDTCPVCSVRFTAKKNNPDGYKDEFRMDYRYYFNVYFEGAVKVWSFTSGVGRQLKVFNERYGDLRDYDVSVRKRKTGPMVQNVEYTIIYEMPAPLTLEQSEANRYDRAEFIKPAPREALQSIARGEVPARTDTVEETPKTETHSASTKATKADMIMLKALVAEKNFELSDFGIVEASPPSKQVIDKLIKELQSEKQ